MKIGALHHGTLCLTSGRNVFLKSVESQPGMVGTIPNPCTGIERLTYNLKTGGILAKLRRLVTGAVHSVNVWFIDEETLLANATNHLYLSRDRGQTWIKIKTLHPSSGIRGVLPNGLCYHDGTIYVGEYIFDESQSPRVFASDDLGETWRIELILDGVRHVHAVQPDPYTGDVWIATGDRDDESKIGRLVDGRLKVLGTGSQLWRAVELVFTPDHLFWGTDCPYQKNHVLRVDREEFGERPNPESVCTVNDPIYYSTSAEIDGEIIILFSTGSGSTTDSTAPESVSQSATSDRFVGVYGGSSATDFSEWHELTTYAVKKCLANFIGRHDFAANAYVFLESSSEQGFFVNPINTATNDGEIHHVRSDAIGRDGLKSAFHGL